MTAREPHALQIGWASADITPSEPVQLAGQHYARVSEGVRDPVTATVLALAADCGHTQDAVLLISCDLVSISDSLLAAVRERVAKRLPTLPPTVVIMNATHTHTAPLARTENDEQKRAVGAFDRRQRLRIRASQLAGRSGGRRHGGRLDARAVERTLELSRAPNGATRCGGTRQAAPTRRTHRP